MNYKYALELEQVRETHDIPCPCSNTHKCESMLLYRFTHNPIITEDFLPVAKLSKKPRIFPKDKINGYCSVWALSMYQSCEEAKSAWLGIAEKNRLSLGYSSVAKLSFSNSDGILSEIDTTGHCDLYESDKTNIFEKSIIDSYL